MYNAMGDIYIPEKTQREVIVEQENTLYISQSSLMLTITVIVGFCAVLKFLDKRIDKKNEPLKVAIKQNTDCIEEFKKKQDDSNENIVVIKEAVARIEGRLNPVK